MTEKAEKQNQLEAAILCNLNHGLVQQSLKYLLPLINTLLLESTISTLNGLKRLFFVMTFINFWSQTLISENILKFKGGAFCRYVGTLSFLLCFSINLKLL